jgi:hypothetical protein
VGGYWAIERRVKSIALLGAEGTAKARLKTATNLWCVLWAWPLEDEARMPDQLKLTKELSEILKVEADAETTSSEAKLTLLAAGKSSRLPCSAPKRASDVPGDGDVKGGNWSVLVRTAQNQCQRLRPHPWELEFLDVFTKNGGFDLTMGNPPWIKLQWNEQGLPQELDPRLAGGGVRALDTAKKRMTVLKRGGTDAHTEAKTERLGVKGVVI